MAKVQNILQIGQEDWSKTVDIPDNLDWWFCEPQDLQAFMMVLQRHEDQEDIKMKFSGLLLTAPVSERDLALLDKYVDVYTVFYDEKTVLMSETSTGFLRKKMCRMIDTAGNKERVIELFSHHLAPAPYDSVKFKNAILDVMPNFSGEVAFDGHLWTRFVGDFGEDFTPLCAFKYNVATSASALEFWLDYVKSGDCTLELHIDKLQAGSIATLNGVEILTEEMMAAPVILPRDEAVGFYSISIYAKGSGEIKIGNMHNRKSREGLGQFILGGERFSDTSHQELIHYFNPGDMKPPLNVYFSGYRSAEGFEGYWMMKSMKAPFMLIGDPRLEGGCFYAGSEELERKLVQVISDALDYLGFDKSELILSGISMGSFGALYYASDFDPTAVIVSKPFTNIGTAAEVIKLKRPDEFETSIDMLRLTTGGIDDENIVALNQKFWDKFAKSDFKKTKFAISYMQHDDYDNQAFPRLLDYMADKDIQIFGQGYAGRHNDNSGAVNRWLVAQYHRILREDFGRKIE